MESKTNLEVKQLQICFYANEDETENVMVAFDDIEVAKQTDMVQGLGRVKGPIKCLYIASKEDDSKIVTL